MQSSFSIPHNMLWVILILPVLFSTYCFASRYSEISLLCGSAQASPNSTVSTSFIQNFVKIMESIQRQVAVGKRGFDSIHSPLPENYAFAQCHDDLSNMDCRLCISQGRMKLPRCLPATSGRIYLEGCYIRYDNYSFFNEALDPNYDSVNCTSQAGALTDNSLHIQLTNKVTQLIDNVTQKAIGNGTFAAMEAKGVVPAYAMAQCWYTLDKESCKMCLAKAGAMLKQCAPGAEGRAMFAGCFMMYSTEKFYGSSMESNDRRRFNAGTTAAIILSAVVFIILAVLGAFIGYDRLSKKKEDQNNLGRLAATGNLHFKYELLEKATDFFNESRKLGQGGAGSVFKGILPDGRAVAVKRLVYNTRQWVDQFFNEVNLISGIQHSNLVRLLGCSIEGPESLLVYEYVPNKSLDQILFIKNTVHSLSWEQRFNIILGTAQGLAYLHGGSGEKIIHRDIKTSNILLDENLIPKIADFGLARVLATDNSHLTTGIAGTLGYMAPEYLVKGQLTEKADVYGFGVLVVEIASGKKNSVFSQGSSSILHSVWKHYKTNTITQTVDARLQGRFPEKQAANVIQIGLLCTQASAALRPSMAEVVQMLTNEDCEIESPKQPPFLNASVLSSEDNTESCITQVPLSTAIREQRATAEGQSSKAQNSGATPSGPDSDHPIIIQQSEPS